MQHDLAQHKIVAANAAVTFEHGLVSLDVTVRGLHEIADALDAVFDCHFDMTRALRFSMLHEATNSVTTLSPSGHACVLASVLEDIAATTSSTVIRDLAAAAADYSNVVVDVVDMPMAAANTLFDVDDSPHPGVADVAVLMTIDACYPLTQGIDVACTQLTQFGMLGTCLGFGLSPATNSSLQELTFRQRSLIAGVALLHLSHDEHVQGSVSAMVLAFFDATQHSVGSGPGGAPFGANRLSQHRITALRRLKQLRIPDASAMSGVLMILVQTTLDDLRN
jgi:hypothetical protein